LFFNHQNLTPHVVISLQGNQPNWEHEEI
jgi:hypothetical protein